MPPTIICDTLNRNSMLTYHQQIELREKLINGEIDVKSAKEQFWKNFKEGKKSWHTKDWKERRDNLIKDECEICGSRETLTLQHLSHPRKFREYVREVTGRYASEYRSTNPEVDKESLRRYIQENYEYVATPFCPHCNNSNPNKRVRKRPTFRCSNCRNEFDDPIYKTVAELISIFYENEEAPEVREKTFVSKQWRTKNHLSNVRYWLQRDQAQSKNAEIINKEAFLLYLNDNIKYLSFEDTITACNKCTFSLDRKNMELCPKCKQNYKGIQYPTCIDCLPEEKRQAAFEMIEFGKQWQQMEKDLGID